MIIETVKTQEDSYLVNGTTSVPNDPANKDYQDILDWINAGNTPTGPDVIAPDYIALRTGPDGYAPIHEQLAMQTDGTWDAHVADVKTRFPKSNTGSTTIGDVPQDILDAAAAKAADQQP
jgi:ABC-type glycerol-3-phosphate transport system substrate-binding protein